MITPGVDAFRPEIDQDVNSNKASVEHEPSKTAMGTATLRALAAADESVRGPDRLAEIFLPEERRRALKDPAAGKRTLFEKTIPGMYEFMIARTAFFDALVERVLREAVPQVVFLGAGYDTRACRFAAGIRGTRIFELDARPTQQRKIEVLKNAGIPLPRELTFVPVNFKTDNLAECLTKAGFDKGRETLFVWEGVSYYLPAAVVDLTLKLVKTCSPAGSSIGFDYSCLPPENLKEEGIRRLGQMMRSKYAGEPAGFSIKAGGLEEYLSARGFAIREHLDANDMKKKYLGFPGAPPGEIPSPFRLVHAFVCAP